MAKRRFTAFYDDGEVVAMFARGGPLFSEFLLWRKRREDETGDRIKTRDLDVDIPEGRNTPLVPLNLRETK